MRTESWWPGGSGLAAVALLAFVAPAPPPAKRAPVYPITETMRIDPALPILVAPPEIEVSSYKVGREQRRVGLPTDEIAQWIRQTEIDSLRQRGFSLSHENQEAGDLLAALVGRSAGLMRRKPDSEDAISALRQACEGRQNVALLAQHLRIKVAPGRTWDPHSGQSTLDMSNSHLRAVLFDCQGYGRLWEGELYIRILPRIGDDHFEAAVAGTFANLERDDE